LRSKQLWCALQDSNLRPPWFVAVSERFDVFSDRVIWSGIAVRESDAASAS